MSVLPGRVVTGAASVLVLAGVALAILGSGGPGAGSSPVSPSEGLTPAQLAGQRMVAGFEGRNLPGRLRKALRQGRVERRAGVASALASLITLSTGGSSGREGPVVHMAAVISTWVARRINANGITGRDLLGCAVAAAVSASFNAPIAGAIFALEVVLRHFAVHAFAPIAIASVAGTVINRIEYGGVTEGNAHPHASIRYRRNACAAIAATARRYSVGQY